MIKCADWIIDLGPEGGERGGEIVGTGAPEEIADRPESLTGNFLRAMFKKE
jgi:excinuclease ABC subunit A